MTGISKQFVYELAARKLGDRAKTWLDTPHPQLTQPYSHRQDDTH